MSESDSSFFKELQVEFLSESAFMFEQYEESMLGLESGDNVQDDLAKIFRVAHSIKGGAAAVGFPDLAKFAHIVEDLLAILRTQPDLLNSEIISLLLKSGDRLKNRILSLQSGNEGAWETADLATQLIGVTKGFSNDGDSYSAKGSGNSQTHQNEIGAVESPFLEKKEELSIDEIQEQLRKEEAAALLRTDELDSKLPLMDLVIPEKDEKLNSENSSLIGDLTPDMKSNSMSANPFEVSIDSKLETKNVADSNQKTEAEVPSNKNLSESLMKPEDKPSRAKDSSIKAVNQRQVNSSIKVDTARVDSVLDAVGELVVLKNQIIHDESIQTGANPRLAAIVDQLDKTVRELYDKTLSIRMTPLKSLFLKIQRIVRDVSITLNKPVELELIGDETEVERTVFELLGDPLVHLVRNAMDHGVEKPEVRKEKNKNPVAKVVVSARQTGGTVTIEIIDDGGGINRERVLAKAIEKNLLPSGVDPKSYTDEQVFQFIFAPGFSTAEKVSDLSGRGVGLDVVKSNLERINGKIDIRSKLGEGTTFRLSIPLTTAITDGIVVAIDGAKYILPIYSIREIVRTEPKDYVQVNDIGRVVKIRESLLPVIDIKKALGEVNWENITNMRYQNETEKNSLRAKRDESMIIVIETINAMVALPVDEVLGQAQVVVKPVNTGRQIPEVSGAAILGDGRTVLILDPSALTQNKNVDKQNYIDREVAA